MSTAEQNSIERIATEATSLKQFYELFLNLLCVKLNGVGAVAWGNVNDKLMPVAQSEQKPNSPIRMSVSQSHHEVMLNSALKNASPVLLRSKKAPPKGEALFPTILVAQIQRGSEIDLIELFIPGELSPEATISRLRELSLLCKEAEKSHTALAANAQLTANEASDPQLLMQAPEPIEISTGQMDEYSHIVHQSLDPVVTASKIANETRRVLDCDRVTVMKVTGSRVTTVAVSGQPSVNRRSNSVSLLERATRKIIATRQTFWFPSESQQPPQIENVLREYLAISATRSLVVYPVFDSVDRDLSHPDSLDKKNDTPKKLIGGIVIEHCKEQWNPELVSPAIDMVCRHAADAWRNSWQHRNLFAYPMWHWLGKSKVLTSAKTLPKTVAVAAGLTVATLAMMFVQTDFRMTCDGVLLPETRRNVFANISGVVREVGVEHGQKVEAGQPLVKLQNIELAQQIESTAGKTQELIALIRSIRTSMSDTRKKDAPQRKENILALEAQLTSARRELRLLKEKQKRLIVTSPIDGVVVTYDVRDSLQGRPVDRIDTLMEVADLGGNWQLELNLPDRKIGHVVRAFENNAGKPLDVEFILAADAGKTLTGKLVQIGRSTEMIPEKGQHLKLKVEVDRQSLSIKQLRSGVEAYVNCGRCSLGYAMFHPIKEFIQTKVLFPFL